MLSIAKSLFAAKCRKARMRQSLPLQMEELEGRLVPTITGLGNEIHVNSQTLGNQTQPAVAARQTRRTVTPCLTTRPRRGNPPVYRARVWAP